jgi:hypothetical protein
VKIYRIIPDFDRCQHFDPGLFPGRDELGNAMFRGQSLLQPWKRRSVTLLPMGGQEKTDFVTVKWTYAPFAVNAHAASVLRPIVQGSCELLPFRYGKDAYWVLYVRGTADCLDVRRTVFHTEIEEDHSPRNVLVAAFDPERLPGHWLFRVTGGHDYYVTQELKDAIEKANLTGIRFQFMWSDDGSEPAESEVKPPKARPKRRKKPGRAKTNRDLLLECLWREVILPRGDLDRLERDLAVSRLLGGSDRYDSARAVRKLARAGVDREDLLDLLRSLAYEVVFDVLVAIEEQCEDKSSALKSLHEDLLLAEPD